jgi:hypothetical protein
MGEEMKMFIIALVYNAVGFFVGIAGGLYYAGYQRGRGKWE